MEPSFSNLRAVIYTDIEEFTRFRYLVVNSVMATDVMDREIGAARKARWLQAFDTQGSKGDNSVVAEAINDRKATIVIEHLIQASDVAHTMQHWHMFTKWNGRLFQECYQAYLSGRAETDPSIGWYEGELGFFDFYVIPLAKKLKESGVFGVSSDEYLNYATQNRKEWEEKGKDIVAGYTKKYKK